MVFVIQWKMCKDYKKFMRSVKNYSRWNSSEANIRGINIYCLHSGIIQAEI